jgi:NAD(P)H-hydrate repair Nnr-like enzyme with NAD(P)H-hydrate epimerase domain
MHGAYPILSCEEAKAFEAAHFAGDETREWAAMQAAGSAVARGIARDFEEIGAWPARARVLVLAGKGHNAGDAFIAATELCKIFSNTVVEVDAMLAFGERALRPLALRAWRELAPRARRIEQEAIADGDVVIDGVFGFQFRPPLPTEIGALLSRVNKTSFRLRAAVDLPSGLDAPEAFQADFSYATGIVKTPLPTLPNAGRVRFLDLGFPLVCHQFGDNALGTAVLDPVRALRPARSDKRTFGHVLIVAGSRRYPGAALMATLAALRGGAGLVTAAVPESLVPTFAAQVPEAMWIGLPETPDGGLALEGFHLVREAFGRAAAVVLGPGIGRERETLALAAEIVAASPKPLVIDADALQPEVVARGEAARVLTPHAG